jgi:hypothetical protein
MSESETAQAPPPQAQLMQMAMGFCASYLLRAAVQLSLADHLADGPKTASQLAILTHAHAPSLHRLLRTLASIGIFAEDDEHRFSLNALTEPLRANVPGSVHNSILSFTGPLFTIPWSRLDYCALTGQPSFDANFGVPFFEYLPTQPEEAAWFSDLLIGLNSADAPAVADAYDFSPFAHIADIGGATGHILATVLAAHPGPRGTIFDLPHNQAAATELVATRGLADRIHFFPGSFFESIPEGCDLYILSHVLHDWSEHECLTILTNCHLAMASTSRLLILEMVLPEGNAFHPGKMLDITMLATTQGQERTEAEYRTLLAKANFQLTRVIPTTSAISILEAVPV